MADQPVKVDQQATQLPPPAPLPTCPVPQTCPAVTHPTTAQVVSAAVQNIVVALCISAAWYLGRIPSEIAVPVLCLVVGIDFVNRKRLPGAVPGAIVTFGATGLFEALGRLPHVGTVVFAALTALGLVSCS